MPPMKTNGGFAVLNRTIFASLVICCLSNVAFGKPVTEATFSSPEARLLSSFTSPDGAHWGAIFDVKGVNLLVVDEVPIAHAEQIHRATVSNKGEAVYWYQEGEKHFLASPSGTAGPFDQIYSPDLHALAGYGVTLPDDLDFRGGVRVVFGARDHEGNWQALVRYPAEPQAQDVRPLPTSKVVPTGSDATLTRVQPLGFSLVRPSVPFAIAVDGDQECVLVGNTNYGCGSQVAMLAFAPATGRIAFALERANRLYVNSGRKVMGPVPNVDWVSFSRDGKHLAFVVRFENRNVLIQDDVAVAEHPRIEGAVWTPDNKLIAIAHLTDRSLLLSNGKVTLETLGITGVFVSPTGEVRAAGYDQDGRFVQGVDNESRYESIYQEGFLLDGRMYATLSQEKGGKSFAVDGKKTPLLSGVERLETSPGSGAVVAVLGMDGVRHFFKDGEPWFETRASLNSIVWCGHRPFAQIREGEEDRLVADNGETAVSCPRLVFAVCAGETVEALCMEEGKFLLKMGGEVVDEWKEVPLDLACGTHGGTRSAFAGRNADGWILRYPDRALPAAARPIATLPTPAGAWYLLREGKTSRWVTPAGSHDSYSSVTQPVMLDGYAIYRGRKDGNESWVVDGKAMGWYKQLESPPTVAGGRLLFWVRTKQGLQLEAVSLK